MKDQSKEQSKADINVRLDELITELNVEPAPLPKREQWYEEDENTRSSQPNAKLPILVVVLSVIVGLIIVFIMSNANSLPHPPPIMKHRPSVELCEPKPCVMKTYKPKPNKPADPVSEFVDGVIKNIIKTIKPAKPAKPATPTIKE